MARRGVPFTEDAVRGQEPQPESSSAVIFSRAGYEVDTSVSVWHIPHPSRSISLNWGDVEIRDNQVLQATKTYFRYLIRSYSAREVGNNWELLKNVWRLNSLANSSDVPKQFFDELYNSLPDHQEYRLHFARKWYVWCSDAGFAPFSPEVAFELEQRVIGGNKKGVAVRSADPEEGPLQEGEVAALANALRSAKMTGKIDLTGQLAVWLALAFGTNPEPISLLREEDFWTLDDSEGEAPTYLLNIPRHKKGDAAPRTQFRERRVNQEIGEMIGLLISRNRRENPPRNGDLVGRPLFRRQKPRSDFPTEGPGSDYRHHYTSAELSALVTRAVERLGVNSPRTGRPLRVTMRRLRYTLATRLVREGASRRVVAQLLDHTDLQNVGVYFDTNSDVVERLDKAAAFELAPLAQAFLGTVVRSEKEAVRGHRPSSRIYHRDMKRDRLDALGTCGSFSFCGLTAPIACYTCVRFQPWMDAPHDKALGALLSERERREHAGLAPGMVEIFDLTILAIADVIRRIDDIREGGLHAG